ncbi:MAG: NirD/YgiW/YdeI family stress tolerance protein [Chitinispirillia bacterium]|nr:NirD/YgiW/YdeI family stress tolerance protein [Chitinispirillia bacterium]MCL2269028.1 NirD/YgiW/YdeI family stress tolerance protein [Chitinispirillia bacterium]
MKKSLLIGLVVIFALSGCDGLLNSEDDLRSVSVSGAKGLKDGVYVRISGSIDSFLLGEWYIFSDASGSIAVEIEDEVWVRAGVNPAGLEFPVRFEITGEVDKDRGQDAVIEVERIKKL